MTQAVGHAFLQPPHPGGQTYSRWVTEACNWRGGPDNQGGGQKGRRASARARAAGKCLIQAASVGRAAAASMPAARLPPNRGGTRVTVGNTAALIGGRRLGGPHDPAVSEAAAPRRCCANYGTLEHGMLATAGGWAALRASTTAGRAKASGEAPVAGAVCDTKAEREQMQPKALCRLAEQIVTLCGRSSSAVETLTPI
ncbi:hypothetical protein FH972_023760 [Carpinus fangiana]|uniref:Uncharacterized protein n=1 Tax=Carpinus fangiana TaxID=176857 RepID=A0A5N6KW39_9ROSI|nr:hypothetical protein FH972_023760 [Carpinus fangiana]